MEEIQIYVPLAPALEANETALAAGKNVDKNTIQIEVLKTGAWQTPGKGKFTLTASDLEEFAQHYHEDVRPHSSSAGLPVDEEHDKKAALAWLKNPRVEANDKGGHTLKMDAELTGTGAQKVHDGTYKFFSPEVHFLHEDPEGKIPKLRNVLMGGGFTNRPLFKGLAGIPALTASDGTADEDNKIYVDEKEHTVPTLEELRTKKKTEVDEAGLAVLEAAKDQLTDEERKEFFPEAAAPAAAPAAPAAPSPAATAAVAASEGETVTLTASEKATLEANAAKGLEASEKLERLEASEEVTEMFFSEANGLKLPSDLKGKVVDLWLDASEDQRATIKTMAEKMTPMLSANDRRELGSDQTGTGTAVDLLSEEVDKLQASDENISYKDALQKARRQHPDLAKEADAEEVSAMSVVR